MIPTPSCSHQSSNWSFVTNAAVMSKIPLKSRKSPISAASVANALCGCTNAQTAARTKRTPRIPCTIFQPDVETVIWKNSFSAGEQRHEPEQERDRVHGRVVPLEDDQREDEPRDPGQQEEPPALGGFFDDLSLFEHHGASIRRDERDSCSGSTRPGRQAAARAAPRRTGREPRSASSNAPRAEARARAAGSSAGRTRAAAARAGAPRSPAGAPERARASGTGRRASTITSATARAGGVTVIVFPAICAEKYSRNAPSDRGSTSAGTPKRRATTDISL